MTPFPISRATHGGRVRAFRLAAGLATAGAHVDILAPWFPRQPPRVYERDGVTIRPHFFPANALALLPAAFLPPLIALSAPPRGPSAKRWLRALARYDIAHFDFCAHPDWMERAPRGVKVVYSAHNVEYDYLRLQPLFRGVRGQMLRRMRALEQRAVQASDLVVTCTAADASRMAELYGPKTMEVIPNGFDDRSLRPFAPAERVGARKRLQIPPHDRVLLFVGGPAPHNRDAVRFLVDDLRPRLRSHTTLLLAGQAATTRSRRDSGDAGVRRLGFVDDLQTAFAAADVGMNPVGGGTGSSLKMIEYLAAGLPVVTTPSGARGLEIPSDRVRVAELEDFADALSSSIPQPGRRDRWISRFAWSELAAKLHNRYQELLQHSLPSARASRAGAADSEPDRSALGRQGRGFAQTRS